MAEITAINNTGSQSIIGRIAKIDTRLINGYVYTRLVDTLPLGVVANASPHKSPSRIITTGVAHVSVIGRVKRNDPIRLAKTGDVGVSQGQCVVAKSGDAPYLKVGTAQASGTKLIPVSLEWAWVSAGAEGDELVKLDQTTQQTGIGQLYFPRAKFGTSTNYTEFEADGTMKASGAAITFSDKACPLIVRTIGANRPTLAALVGNILQYTFAVDDIAEVEGEEFAHDWKEGTELEIHVHWTTNGTDATDRFVRWEVEYSWANHGTVFPAPTIASAEATIPADTPSHTLFVTSITTFTPATGKIGAQIIFRLRRIAATGGAAPSGNVFGLDIGIHYEQDTLGSRQRYIK